MFRRLAAGIGVAGVLAGAYVGVDAGRAGAPPAPAAVPTTTAAAPATTTSTRAADDGTFAVQQRLEALGYDVGTPDGTFGERTRFALIAFQKVEGLARDGKPGAAVAAALARASAPRPVLPGGEATRIEIDLMRQVLLYWRAGKLARVLPVSTGDGRVHCLAGRCERAVTPTGRFTIQRKVPGVDDGPLGKLYAPMYFHNGVAIHGYPSVPATPASHGCARIPMYASTSLFEQVAVGTPVYVVAR